MTDLTSTATKIHVEQAILEKLQKVKGPDSQGNYKALCPFHDDHNPSLSVNFEKGCYNCFACGSGGPITRLAQRLGVDSYINSNKDIGGDTDIGEGCYSVTPPVKRGKLASKEDKKSVTFPALQAVTGVTVDQLAEAKHLSVDFLKGLGLRDFKYYGQPAIKIPYYGEISDELAFRYRLAITGGNRFKWRKGDHPLLYGLNGLKDIRKVGWVMLVEGESDCWACWFHGIPALGVPGKGIWSISWGQYLEGLDVYVWQEPEAEDFVLRILSSATDLRYVPAPSEIKDISEAHVQGYDIPSWLEDLKSRAESGRELRDRYDNEQLQQVYIKAKSVIEANDTLKLIEDAIRGCGYGGDIKPAIITYLSVTSRVIEMRDGAMPVHLLIMGASSSGKSYTLNVVKRLFPSESYHTISAGSPRTIIYDDADLQHRLLVFGEADSLPAGEDNPAASAIRNLLQDHQLHYEVTVKDPDTGNFVVRKVIKPGPTVLITTSTRLLGTQLMTRLFTLEIGDSKEQIVAALKTQAVLETEGSQSIDDALVDYQHYLQLKAPFRVIVPFAGELALGMSKVADAPRINRDFARILSLIKSVAIIRHHWRQTDNEGRLVATIADYETVRELVNDMYIVSSLGANNDIRRLVEAVRLLDESRTEGERVTVTKLAKHLGINKMAASRRTKRAIKEDWLINRESRKGYPADFMIGEPMPEVEGLPVLGCNPVTSSNTPLVTDSSFKNGGCNAVTPLTDDNIYPLPLDKDIVEV